MKHFSQLVIFFLFLPCLSAQNVPVQEFILDNGMKLLMVPRKGDPNIAAGWIAKVGSVNERPGITGMSHLFEHMMFKGTHVIGTRNIQEDLKLIDEMDNLKTQLHKEEQVLIDRYRLGEIDDLVDPKNRSPRHQELLGKYEKLLEREKELIVKEEFTRVYTTAGASVEVPPVPKPNHAIQPGIYAVNKPDVNQGRVVMGHLGSQRDNPDFYALSIMDDILGGGDFTSRIMTRVRSDEGLAYSAASNYGFAVYYDGSFQASFQSKSPTCAQATAIVLEEIERIQSQKVGPEELETAINAAVGFPRYFSSAAAIAGTFANDDYTRRKPDFWDTYRDRIYAVTADDVLRVAKKYLMPDKVVILAVGNVDEMLKGNPDKPGFSFKKLAKEGEIHRIPLPDPLTMVYP